MIDKSISAVIFDLDGTLIDSKSVMQDAYIAAFNEVVGADKDPPPFSEYCKHLGCSFQEILRRLNLPFEIQSVFERESLSNIHRIRMFENILPMLHCLAERNIPLAIATGKNNARSRKILEHLGIIDYFSRIVGSDDVSKPKPAPDMVLKIISELNLYSTTTLFVGDQVADILCGQAAGVRTAIALWDESVTAVIENLADYNFEHPLQIITLLDYGFYQ